METIEYTDKDDTLKQIHQKWYQIKGSRNWHHCDCHL